MEEDFEFERIWKQGKNSRRAKRTFDFTTEKLPKELKKLELVVKAFSKIKLNDKGLPF